MPSLRTARRTLALWGPVVLVVGTLAACDAGSDEPSGPDPDKATAALATALTTGDFTGVDFAAPATGPATTPAAAAASYSTIVEGMGGVQPKVEAGDVEQADDSTTATLTWTWPVGGQDWTYDVEAPLTRSGDTWQVTWEPSLVEPTLVGGTVLDATSIAAARGPIIGAGGVDLVTGRPVTRFGIDRARIPAARAGASARRLAALVDIDVAAYVKQVEAAGDKAFVEAISYRRDEVPTRVAQGYDSISGAVALAYEQQLAPTKEFAAPILGTVGDVTAEMVKKDPERYQPGDQAGLSGLQARYDDQLRGTPGAVVDAVTSDGKERELFRVDEQDGKALRLTLDVGLQQEAESLLAPIGPASALVALRPSTGDIVAAANGPGNGGYNMATFGQFAPGSTFKTVTSLALLRAGLTPDTVVPCTPTLSVDGKSFKNYSDYPAGGIGDIPLRTALANSCNTAFISQADRLGDEDLVDAAASLGLGVDHDLGFPAYFGSVVPPASATEKAADMIGQGKVLASPMAMAAVIASAQKGEVVVPRLVDQVKVSAPSGVTPMTSGEAARLKAMLAGVVTSGSGSQLADLPGPPAIAKTGTAEFERNGRVLTHAWMVAAQGDLAVAVFVDEGASGSGTAGPILESFLRAAR